MLYFKEVVLLCYYFDGLRILVNPLKDVFINLLNPLVNPLVLLRNYDIFHEVKSYSAIDWVAFASTSIH